MALEWQEAKLRRLHENYEFAVDREGEAARHGGGEG
jgi:hypothetical protein